MATQTGHRSRVAAVVLLLAAVLALTTAGPNTSAAVGSTNENRVKAFNAAVVNGVGASEHIAAGQRRGEPVPQLRPAEGRGVHTYYVGVGQGAVLVHNCGDLDAFSVSGQRPVGSQGQTAAGQELEKHAGGLFPVGPFGSAAQRSALGQSILDDILTAPGTVRLPVTSGNFAGGTRFIDRAGRGATFDKGGMFRYFGEYPVP